MPGRSSCLAIIVICAALIAEPVSARVLHTTKTVYHPVRGQDAAAMLAYLFRHPVDGKKSRLASLLSRMSVTRLDVAPGPRGSATRGKTAAGCHVRAVELKVAFTITVPRAVETARLDAKTRKAWRAFVATARAHEEEHLAINLEMYRRIDREISALSTGKSCKSLSARMDRIVESAVRRGIARHTALDKRDTRRTPALPLFRMAGLTDSNIEAFMADSEHRKSDVSALLLRREFRNR